MKKGKDNILKKFIAVCVCAVCVFSLAAGVVAAYDNTSSQLQNRKADLIYENDVIEFVEEKILGIT